MNSRFFARIVSCIGAFLVCSAPAWSLNANPGTTGDGSLRFEPNLGQTAAQVSFLARARGQVVFVQKAGVVLKLGGTAGVQAVKTPPVESLNVRFLGATGASLMAHGEPVPGATNYFLGRTRRLSHVPAYRSIRLKDVYKGIDVVVYGREGRLEYDFVLEPGSDPSRIRLGFDGAASLELNGAGDLVIGTPSGRHIVQHSPVLYQIHNGIRTPVEGRFFQDRAGNVRISVPHYDRGTRLVIDPVLSWATYFGGSDRDLAMAVAVDGSGNSFFCGKTLSTDFPVKDPYQDQPGGLYTVFVTRMNSSGDLVWSTYLGGENNDAAEAIALDGSGNVYVAGWTFSSDFPVANAAQGTLAGSSDAFIAKLSGAGDRLIYSSYFGGAKREECYGLAVDGAGKATLCGNTESSDLPVHNAAQSAHGGGRLDAFVARFNASGSSIAYATYLGGDKDDTARAVAVDGGGAAYLAGDTASANFPVKNAYQSEKSAYGTAAFVTKLNASGSLSYSTYLSAHSQEWAYGIDVDGSGRAVVCGRTSSDDFPTVGAYQDDRAGSDDTFLARFSSGGSSLEYGSYFGGSSHDWCNGIRVGADGRWSFVGITESNDYPLASADQAVLGGDRDAVVTILDPGSNTLAYSSYFGGAGADEAFGLSLDGSGNVYAAGRTESENLPVLDAEQGSLNGAEDAFLLKVRGGGAPAANAYVVGPVIHAPGAHSSQWRSDLTLICPGGASATIMMTAKTSAGTKTKNITLAAGGTLRWKDVLVSLFGFGSGSSASGTLEITSSQPLEILSRAYSEGAAGTTGQFIPGLAAGDGITPSRDGIIGNIMQSGDFRTNLGGVNMSDASVTIRITLYDTHGAKLGASVTMNLGPYQFKQIDKILDKAGVGNTDLAYAKLEVTSAGGEAWAYASVIDNHTNDPTTIPVALQ